MCMICMCAAGSVVDRKISFAVLGANERSDSLHSSTTSISQLEAAATDGKGHCAALNSLVSRVLCFMEPPFYFAH